MTGDYAPTPVLCHAVTIGCHPCAVSFVLVRSVISVPLIYWYMKQMLVDSHAIPFPWRLFMVSLVGLGMAGSQIWSYKLVRGCLRSRRKKKVQ